MGTRFTLEFKLLGVKLVILAALTSEMGDTGLLMDVLTRRTRPGHAGPAPKSQPRTAHKLTPEVVSLVRQMAGSDVAAVVACVRERHGYSLSPNTVYKVWRGAGR